MNQYPKPTVIKEFPGKNVELFLRLHGHLPNKECGDMLKKCSLPNPKMDERKTGLCFRCRKEAELIYYYGEYICKECMEDVEG